MTGLQEGLSVVGIGCAVHRPSLWFFSWNMGMTPTFCVCSDDVRFIVGCVTALGYVPLTHLYFVDIMDLVLRTDLWYASADVAPISAFTRGNAMTGDMVAFVTNPTGIVPRKGVLTLELRLVLPMYDRVFEPPLMENVL